MQSPNLSPKWTRRWVALALCGGLFAATRRGTKAPAHFQGRVLPIAALTLCLSCGGSEGESDTAKIDQVLQASVAASRVNGVVAMATSKDDVIYQGAFGRKDIDAAEPMRADTIFRIFSMTKPVTSVAVMQLVEKGKVDLDAALGAYLPDFGDIQVLEGFDEQGVPRLHNASRAPTIGEMLSNTSGYVYSSLNENMQRYEAGAATPDSREKFAALPLAFEPGARWEYGPSTDVLGILIETISGQTLGALFPRKHLQAPWDERYFVSGSR